MTTGHTYTVTREAPATHIRGVMASIHDEWPMPEECHTWSCLPGKALREGARMTCGPGSVLLLAERMPGSPEGRPGWRWHLGFGVQAARGLRWVWVSPVEAWPLTRELARHPAREVRALAWKGFRGDLGTLVRYIHAVKKGLVFPAYG
jgi:hypothetical protein